MCLEREITELAQRTFLDSLNLIEWPTVCEHLSTFTSTSLGRNECKKLAIPADIATSKRLLDSTVEMVGLDEEIENGISFEGIYDITDIIKRCSKGGIVQGEELLLVADTLSSSRRLRRQIDNTAMRPVLSALFNDYATLPELEKQLKIGLEEGGRIADRASKDLELFRRQLFKLMSDRRILIQDILQKYSSLLQDSIISIRFGRPVISIKSNAIDQVKGTIHDYSSSGSTIYIEPSRLIPLNNKIIAMEAKIFKEEQRLLAIWSNIVGKEVVNISHLLNVIRFLDLSLARARYGMWIGGVIPEINADGKSSFSLQNFRHPLLIWQAAHGNGSRVVPISFDINSELRVVAVTGPNTGGKTASIKSIGLAAIMTRFGLLLPCSGTPKVPWFSMIFADIGDEQSLQQNLSTFSSHILRISSILNSSKHVNGDSLVLLDEIGAGTDPSEGAAIAIALLKKFAEISKLTVATTHYGELKSLKYKDRRFENASVGFDDETLNPTYLLQWGIPGRSNAISISSRLGLDPEVVNLASELIDHRGIEDVNSIIEGLEKEKRLQQEASENTAAILARAELLHDELQAEWKKHKLRTEAFREEGRLKLSDSIRQGQTEVRKLIRRLRDGEADGEIARKTGRRLREIERKNLNNVINKKSHSYWIPQKGDRVRVLSLGKVGEVISISDNGTILKIQCGPFRSVVPIEEIESIEGLKPKNLSVKVNFNKNQNNKKTFACKSKSNTLDVRGLRVHEAESEIEEKMRHSSTPIWVVHGVGSGKLKRGIREWLSGLPYVERYSDAETHDGGAGCTVIWLN